MRGEAKLFATMLASVGSPEAAADDGPEVGPGEQIVAIGDSITENGGYLWAMEAVFAQQYGALKILPIVNVGLSGQKAEDLIARFGRDVVERGPAIAMISVGVNDVWHRLDAPHDERVLVRFSENLERMVCMARDAGIRAYLLAPTVIEENVASEGNRRLARYVAAGKAIARGNGCKYVDLHALFLDAIGSRAPGAGRAAAPPLTRDGVHMGPPGDVLMAVGILRAWAVPDEKMAATDLSGVLS